MSKKIPPDSEDYAAIERIKGRLRSNATTTELAEAYRLAQAHKLLRLYDAGRLHDLTATTTCQPGR